MLVGGPKDKKILGPLGRMIRTLVGFSVSRRRARAFIADANRDDLALLAGLLEAGELRTVVDRVYPLEEIGAAMDHLAGGHARGKVIVRVG